MAKKYQGALVLGSLLLFPLLHSQTALAIVAESKGIVVGRVPTLKEAINERLGVKDESTVYTTLTANGFLDLPGLVTLNKLTPIVDTSGDLADLVEDEDGDTPHGVESKDETVLWKDNSGTTIPAEELASLNLCTISAKYAAPYTLSVSALVTPFTEKGVPTRPDQPELVEKDYKVESYASTSDKCDELNHGIVRAIVPAFIDATDQTIDSSKFVPGEGFKMSAGFPTTGFEHGSFTIKLNKNPGDYEFISDNPAVAKVNSNGLVTLVGLDGAPGSAMSGRGRVTININSKVGGESTSYSFKINEWFKLNRVGTAATQCAIRPFNSSATSCATYCDIMGESTGEDYRIPALERLTDSRTISSGSKTLGNLISEWGELSPYRTEGSSLTIYPLRARYQSSSVGAGSSYFSANTPRGGALAATATSMSYLLCSINR